MTIKDQGLPSPGSSVCPHHNRPSRIAVTLIIARICLHPFIVRFKYIYLAAKAFQEPGHIHLRSALLPILAMTYDRSIKAHQLTQKVQIIVLLPIYHLL